MKFTRPKRTQKSTFGAPIRWWWPSAPRSPAQTRWINLEKVRLCLRFRGAAVLWKTGHVLILCFWNTQQNQRKTVRQEAEVVLNFFSGRNNEVQYCAHHVSLLWWLINYSFNKVWCCYQFIVVVNFLLLLWWCYSFKQCSKKSTSKSHNSPWSKCSKAWSALHCCCSSFLWFCKLESRLLLCLEF